MSPSLRVPVLALATALAGCGDDLGAVRIRIETPSEPALSPVDGRVDSLTLVVEADGLPAESRTRSALDRAEGIDFGEVPIRDGVRLTLFASSAAGSVLGYGRAAPIDVGATETIEVPVRLRRPFTFVAGGGDLKAFDPTLEPGQTYVSAIGLASPTAVATTPDGAEVLAIAGGALVIASTADHRPLGFAALPLEPGATDLAVTSDSRWALVVHGAGAGGVTVVDLGALRSGGMFSTFVPIPGADVVAVAGGLAWVLVDAATTDDCAGASSVVPIDVPVARSGVAIPLGTPARDLAVDARTGTLVVAVPCRDALSRFDVSGDTGTLTDLLAVSDPTTVAISAGRAWTMGHVTAPGSARLILGSVGIDGAAPSTIELDIAEERARSNEFSSPGQSAEVRVTADLVVAYDLAVLPDQAHVAVLLGATYHSDQAGDFLGTPIIPAIDIVTYEVQVLDVATAIPLQRMRTWCDISWADNAILFDFSCTNAPGQDQAQPPYIPAHVAALYGER